MEEVTQELNLFQKIADVKANIDGFTKDAKSYNYSYVSGSQVLHRIRNKMIENNLLLIPKTTEENYKQIQVTRFNQKAKREITVTEFVVEMKLTYVWINADKPEEQLEIPFYAVGQQDDVSKAHGTGLTYAERYFLMKFFNIPTDEDDADAKEKQEKYANSSNQLKDILRDEANKFIQIAENSGFSEKYKDEISKLKMMDVNILDKQQIIKTRNLIRRWLGEIES
ncbi:ERF family protein [Staphylococcus haemolyticus]|uniref:ERF family protein n=1 Tax=Staphylococcus haemolyticus TaxID=1283 RepID=A0ABU3IHP2_STAHA|nr:ERF family protein [Staphylococcus haemolyticus]AKC76383.1 ERF superfamily phage protein [Staphylococcus haemolyticus]AUV67649.1 single-stranded DNA-binding protein [Staphylococcus haemolyticus]AUV70026.1 single-stranded DNA-binding protein [Staphylococcus haemolyticus]MBE7361662.1 ERF family protein [Staphylococcus haemolyticus]MBE7377432.1 ERF family protein [Staphylococcus haemolyticus]